MQRKYDESDCRWHPAGPVPFIVRDAFQLAEALATDEEIAECLSVNTDAFLHWLDTDTRFNEMIKRARAQTRAALREQQVKKALGGDAKMLEWAGKQYLDQHDKAQLDSRIITADVTPKSLSSGLSVLLDELRQRADRPQLTGNSG